MADLSNWDRERADALAERERQSAIDAASKAVRSAGAINCIDCSEPIDAARRAAMPSAKRCFACQQSYELDQVMG